MREVIDILRNTYIAIKGGDIAHFKYFKSIELAIEALEKTSDKECSRCTHRNNCAIFDNFNIDYCSDWSEENGK